MGFPYVFESNFEQGTSAEWSTGETDTDSILDFPSYKILAGRGMEPYSGAYCMRIISPGGAPADAFVSAPECNIADTETFWFRLNVLFANDFTTTVTDTCALLELQGAGNNETVAFGFKVTQTTDVINLGIGGAANNAVPGTFSVIPVQRGVWYTVELKVVIQTGGTGTIDMYVTRDGGKQAIVAEASVTTLTNIAVTHAVLGLQDQLATTSGTILIDNFAQDDAQLFRNTRYPETRLLTKSAHAFVGPGKIDSLTLLSGAAANNTCKVYDSDLADEVDLVAEMSNSIAVETVERGESISVQKGAYVVLSGTQPRALVKIGYAPYAAGAVRDLGRAR